MSKVWLLPTKHLCLIAKEKLLFTVKERLELPAAKEIIFNVKEWDSAPKLKAVLLCDTKIKQKIDKIS